MIFYPPINIFSALKLFKPSLKNKQKELKKCHGIGDTIYISQEIQCLPYAGFFLYIFFAILFSETIYI